jgi:CelD/BcsL family acetyltransferase involved in cellulose biosynthesis
MNAAGLNSRVLRPDKLREEEIAAWEDLCDAHPHLHNPFFSPHYVLAVASVRPGVRVCILRRDQRIVGFFPFQYRSAASQLLGSAERVGGEMTDYFGVIAEPDIRLAPADLLRLAGLRYMYFTHLDETQSAYGLHGEQPESGLVLKLEDQEDYWNAEVRKRNPKLYAETGRLERVLERTYGPLRFCFSEEAWQQPLEQLIQDKRRQYALTGSSDALGEPWQRDLLAKLAATRARTCTGALSTLYAGDTWVASHMGLHSRRVFHYWFPVYNPELKRFSPGRLLEKWTIQHAPALGFRLLDHGAGDTQRKRQLTNSEHLYYRGDWYRPGVRGAACRISQAAQWRFGLTLF